MFLVNLLVDRQLVGHYLLLTPAPAPSLTSFTGVSANGSTTCYLAEYTASLDWPDNSSFFSYSNKCVTGTSTSAPSGFGGPGGVFTFQKGLTYYARVYNGNHSNTVSLAVPNTACDSSKFLTF